MNGEPGYMIPALATRTRRARKDGRCALCPCPVRVGQRIGLVAGYWSHVSCIVRVNQSQRKEP